MYVRPRARSGSVRSGDADGPAAPRTGGPELAHRSTNVSLCARSIGAVSDGTAAHTPGYDESPAPASGLVAGVDGLTTSSRTIDDKATTSRIWKHPVPGDDSERNARPAWLVTDLLWKLAPKGSSNDEGPHQRRWHRRVLGRVRRFARHAQRVRRRTRDCVGSASRMLWRTHTRVVATRQPARWRG